MSSAAGGTHHLKVVLLGEGCVGKTSLLMRYIEDKFNDKHLTTLQVNLSLFGALLLLFEALKISIYLRLIAKIL